MTFENLNIITPIAKAIRAVGYTTPTPIQEQAIPHILNGNDILAFAQTGTGKTAAFAIPILQKIEAHQHQNKPIQVLVLTPTRELAIQVNENFNAYATYTDTRSQVIVGGVSAQHQLRALKKKPAVVIATPGRLLDLLSSQALDLSKLHTLVLDEADTMLDMGFIRDIQKIIALLPKQRQTLFFSATIPQRIREFAKTILVRPKEITITPTASGLSLLAQQVCYVPLNEKRPMLISVLKKHNKQTLVFARTKHGANRLVKHLDKARIKALAIHGNKSQNARIDALKKFKSKQVQVLIATDIAARGIDIENLPMVINYELPNIPETYVHRVGRTGRAGMPGKAISFCDTSEHSYLKAIEKLVGKQLEIIEN